MSVVNPVNVEHSTAGWIAEDLVGPVGKEACTALVSQSGTNLSPPVARIVTSYLEKPAKVDVPQLRAGHPGLNLDLGDEVCVSFEVEQLLQMDLDQVIKDDEALQRYKALGSTKVTHVTTLFFKARGMSLLDLNPLNCSVRVDQNSLRNLPKDI